MPVRHVTTVPVLTTMLSLLQTLTRSVIAHLLVSVILATGTCVNYANINNSVLRMRGHVFAGFFRCDVLCLQGKHNGFHHIVATV